MSSRPDPGRPTPADLVRHLDSRGAVVVAALALVAVAVGLGLWFASRPRPAVVESVLDPAASSSEAAERTGGHDAGAAPGGTAAAGAGAVVVDVEGAVRRPGIVRLPAGSRVVDALAAAGGALPGTDTTTLNLARPLSDGEQVLVGLPAGPGAATSGGGAAAPAAGAGAGTGTTGGTGGAAGVLDLNAAGVAELESLPGVGPVLAQRIVDWRTQNGRFSSVEDLRELKGIGDATFADIAPRVRV